MIESPQPPRYRFVIGALSMLANFALGLSYTSVAPVLPLIAEDYDISYASGGLLIGVVMITNASFGLIGGVIVGRLGVRGVLIASLFMMSALTLAAISLNFYGLLLLRIVFGLGTALLFPATGPLIMQWFPRRELPVITGMNNASASLGGAVSFFIAVPLADVLGWERVLGLFGAVALVVAFGWLFFGKTREEAGSAATSLTWRDFWAVLRNRTILVLALADAAVFTEYFALSGWLPTFYNEVRGMSLVQAGFIIGLLPFMGMCGVLLGAFLPSKISSKRLLLIVPGAMVGLGGLGSFLMGDTVLIYISVIVLGLGSWMFLPTLLTLPMDLPDMTPHRIAIFWGLIMTATGIGTAISPITVGAMKDGLGTFVPGFLIFAVLAWFLFISGFLLPKTSPRVSELPGPAAPPAPAHED